jgi:hypothetical protein
MEPVEAALGNLKECCQIEASESIQARHSPAVLVESAQLL